MPHATITMSQASRITPVQMIWVLNGIKDHPKWDKSYKDSDVRFDLIWNVGDSKLSFDDFKNGVEGSSPVATCVRLQGSKGHIKFAVAIPQQSVPDIVKNNPLGIPDEILKAV